MSRIGIGEREESVETFFGRRKGCGNLETGASKARSSDRNEKSFLRRDGTGEILDPSHDEFRPRQSFEHEPMIRGARAGTAGFGRPLYEQSADSAREARSIFR